jgi:putative phosphoesterase
MKWPRCLEEAGLKVLVISDTHGSLDLVAEAGRRALEVGAGLVLHLGDDLEDAAPLAEMGLELRGVQGLFHPEYFAEEPPNRLLIRIEDVALLLTHSPLPHPHDRPEDGVPAEVARNLGASAVLYGHTHVPAIQEHAGLLWINPGHLKAGDKRGWPPTLAILDIEGDRLSVRIEELRGGRLVARWPAQDNC